MTLTPVTGVVIRIPITLAGSGLVLSPALDTFISTAKPLTVDNIIRMRESHTQDWQTEWAELEFESTTTNATALENAASTLQASLNTQNNMTGLVVDAVAVSSTRVQFS